MYKDMFIFSIIGLRHVYFNRAGSILQNLAVSDHTNMKILQNTASYATLEEFVDFRFLKCRGYKGKKAVI